MYIPVAPSWNLTNLLSEEQQKMTGATTEQLYKSTGWIAWTEENSNSRIERTTEFSKWTPASLKLYADGVGPVPVTAKTDTAIKGFDPLDEYRGFAWILGREFKQKVRVGIEWTTAVPSSGDIIEYNYTQVELLDTDAWTLVSYTGQPPSSTSTGRLRIDLPEATDGDYVHIDDAVLLRYGEPSGTFLALLLANIPAYLRILDEEQTAPNQPMYRYLQLMTYTADRMLAASLAFDYVPASDVIANPIFDGYQRSTLVDVSYYPTPDIAEEAWLPWLAFITGTVPVDYVSNEVGASTPWYALPGTWQAYIDAGLLTWDDIQNSLPAPPENTLGLREVIRTKGTGVLAGTFEGIRRTARLALSGYDVPATVTRLDNIATIQVGVHQPGAASGDTVIIYDDTNPIFDGEYTILTSDGAGSVFTIASSGADITTPISVYITNKIVTVERTGTWEISVTTLDAQTTGDGSGVEDILAFTMPAGCVLAYSVV
jgi:hypothetical protein